MINSCCSQACSEPLLFQDSILHAVDVGIEAWGDWTPNGSSKFLQDIGPSLVSVCVQYNHPESAVQHSDLLEEVVTHCSAQGSHIYLWMSGIQGYPKTQDGSSSLSQSTHVWGLVMYHLRAMIRSYSV